MGSCYSVAYSWYAWMVGSQITPAGMLRYRNETVDGETTIEFQHLVDADEELLELGHGNQPVTLITPDERRHLQTGRYDEILVHNTRVSEEIDGQTQKVEQDLRLEEEAYYEARREAARAARQAQALEATRAAAATAAAAQATHTAMIQNADIFSSAALPTASESTLSLTTSPHPDASLRQEAQLTAESQLDEFARSAGQKISSTTSPEKLPTLQERSTFGQSSSSPNDTTTSVERESPSNPQALDTAEASRTEKLPHEPSQGVANETTALVSSSTAGNAVADTTSLVGETAAIVHSGSQPSTGSYTIVDEDDDEDFDSFLESVKAKNFGPEATTKGAEIARGTSPPPIENGDDEFTAFEESLR